MTATTERTLARLAKLSGRPKAQIAAELLNETMPALDKVVSAMEATVEAEGKVNPKMRRAVAALIAQGDQAQGDLLQETAKLREVMAAAPKGVRDRSERTAGPPSRSLPPSRTR